MWLELKSKNLTNLHNKDYWQFWHIQIFPKQINYNPMSLAVQWLRPHTFSSGSAASIPSQETKVPHAVWWYKPKDKETRI